MIYCKSEVEKKVNTYFISLIVRTGQKRSYTFCVTHKYVYNAISVVYHIRSRSMKKWHLLLQIVLIKSISLTHIALSILPDSDGWVGHVGLMCISWKKSNLELLISNISQELCTLFLLLGCVLLWIDTGRFYYISVSFSAISRARGL